MTRRPFQYGDTRLPGASLRGRRQITALGAKVALAVALVSGSLCGQQLERPLDQEQVRSTVEGVAKIVEREYFDQKAAARAGASLRDSLAEGRYGKAATFQSLADRLTRDLFAITKDKHLAVAVVQEEIATAAPANPPNGREERGRRENFGVQRVEILAGNVGYLNLTAFYRADEARETLSAAMRTLRHTDAMILDLRANGGGAPETAALFASYFFDTPELPLFTIVDRSGEARLYATETAPLPERNESRPLYVLTSRQTYSAGEGFAFILQERRRAEIVGETTAGAANPGRPYSINSQFEVTVPNGKVATAVTGRNWEGSGVQPDFPAPASDSLEFAHMRALSKLRSRTP